MRPERLVGLDVLVGLTYLDAEGDLFRQEQFHGFIEESDDRITWIRPSGGGDRRWVPTDTAAFRPAPGGTYRLIATGEVVTNPFLMTSWMHRVLQDEEGETYYESEPIFATLKHSRVPLGWTISYQIDPDRIRRTIEVFGDEYIGRSVLLGISYTGPDGELRSQEQHLGTIMVVDFDQGIVVSCEPDGRTFTLPGDPSWVEKADPGEYRLRSTGEVVENPDYVASITIEQPR